MVSVMAALRGRPLTPQLPTYSNYCSSWCHSNT